MNRIQAMFEQVSFTQQEKSDLTARLQQAAEQEEIMTEAAKRKVKKISRGMVIGVAAACLLTAGALAAAVGPGLQRYFDTSAPGAQAALENGTYRLDRSETYNGWTVTLAECVRDDTRMYIWVDVTAPEGTALIEPENGAISAEYCLQNYPEDYGGHIGGSLSVLPDEDPADNKISFCMEITGRLDALQGETVTIALGPITDVWWTDPMTDRAQGHEGSEMTGAVRDHIWVFSDVRLDCPDRAVCLSPDVEVPYLDGTATLTEITVSPLTTTVRIEGGACEDHHGRRAGAEAQTQGKAEEAEGTQVVVSAGEFTITVGGAGDQDVDSWFDCWNALGVVLHMRDGTQISPVASDYCSCQDGSSPYYEGVPYVEGRFRYSEHSDAVPVRVIDPAQVDYVTVCGVDFPLSDGADRGGPAGV